MNCICGGAGRYRYKCGWNSETLMFESIDNFCSCEIGKSLERINLEFREIQYLDNQKMKAEERR